MADPRADSENTLATIVDGLTRVQAVAFSPRGDVLASTALGEPARLWPVDDRRRAEILVETEDCLHDVKLSGEGSVLTVTGDLRFDRWDAVRARSTGEMGRVSATQETAWSVPGVASDRCVLTGDGHLAAVSTPEAAVRIVQAAPLPASSGETKAALLPELPYSVYGMGFSRDGRLYAALGLRLDAPPMASLVRVWRREPKGWAQTLEIESMAAGRNLVVAPERGLLVFGGRYGTGVEVRSLGDGSLIASFRPHATMLTELTLSPDADLLATAGEDGLLKLWRLPAAPGARPEQAASVQCHPSRINAVVFLPGGRQLLTAPGEGRIRLWHLFEHGTGIRALESLELDHPPGARDLAVSEDGSTVAACGGASGGRGWLKLWWAADPAEIAGRDGR